MPSHMSPDLPSLWEALDAKTNEHIHVPLTEDVGFEALEGNCGTQCSAAEAEDDGDDFDPELIKQELRRLMQRQPQKTDVAGDGGRHIGGDSSSFASHVFPSTTATFVLESSTTSLGAAVGTSPVDSYSVPSSIVTSTSYTTPVSAPEAVVTGTTSPAPTANSSSDSTGLSTAAKIGLGVGLGVGIPLLVALLGCLIFARRRKRARHTAGGKYTPQGNSDVSMVESPIPTPAPQTREVPEMEYYEAPKNFEPATYHAFSPSQDYEHFETPVSAVTPLDPQSARSFPPSPPPLAIPTAEETPRHSLEPPEEREVSPVSPLSPVSRMSSMASRSPSPPRHHEH